ncbi:MAG TPA: DUF4097 family beta strand repeat-containing protein [Candidatus Saccharimonadales bacterium]|nr:DUF4097 family beta strand repeat-containing protein [Candidatus Saccharimonadales bacterium]
MNKITQIHLAKVPYAIEPGAEQELSAYLQAVRSKVDADTASEVMVDIELRITELLASRGIKKGDVITTPDVQAVKEQLGAPEQFADTQPEAVPVTPTSKRRWGLPGALALVGLLVVGFVFWANTLPLNSEPQRQAYQQSIQKLQVNVDSGHVEIKAGATDEIIIERTLMWTGAKPTLSETWNGSTLSVKADCPNEGGWLLFRRSCAVDYVIHVPRAITAEIYTESGGVDVTEIDGDVTVRTEAGNLQFEKLKGALVAESKAGTIDARALQSAKVDATSHAGNIDLRFDAAPKAVTAKTQAGNASIGVPKGAAYTVKADTQAGNREVGVEQNSAAIQTISVESSAGNVSVQYIN